MSKELAILLEGLCLGLGVIGVGGLIIGTTAVPGLVVLAIAVVGYSVLGYVRGAKK